MKTKLSKYREFFTTQGFTTRTYVNGDDLSNWWCLEIKFNDVVKSVFLFHYTTEDLLDWQ